LKGRYSGRLRVGAAYYNTTDEVERLGAALKKVAAAQER
jgi:selenocysteine lyase/cysteine desulfurase